MPPKLAKKAAQITILKFKRARTTYSVPIDLTVKGARSHDGFVSTLADVISSSGGLELVDEEGGPGGAADGDALDADEDNIEVPKSEFIDGEAADEDLDIDVPESEFIDRPSGSSERVLDVKGADLRLAVPKDKTAPYANEWIELADDAALASLVFNDYDIIAFAYGDEEFSVVEAAYEEQQ